MALMPTCAWSSRSRTKTSARADFRHLWSNAARRASAPERKRTSSACGPADTSELIFEDCEIPAENLLGYKARASSMPCACSTADASRLPPSASAWRRARTSARSSIAKQRKQFGKAISEFQAIQWKLADMATEIDAARLLTMRAACHEGCGHEDNAGVFDGQALHHRGCGAGAPMKRCRFMADTASSRTIRRRSFIAT